MGNQAAGQGPALSASGYSNYQHPLLNQSLGGGHGGGLGSGNPAGLGGPALSVHSSYAGGPALSQYGGSQLGHNNPLSTARSEANLNNVGVHNPLLTVGKPQQTLK